MSDKIEMTVTLQVTPAQGLALQAMFNHWNKLASWGSSRNIAFFVDGDGNFHPDAKVSFSEAVPELTEHLSKKAVVGDNDGDLVFDYDPIAWEINH